MNGSATTTQAPAKPRTAPKRRRVIGSFGSYADAKRIVERLSDGRFGGDRSAIIARDLTFVERGGRVRAAFAWATRGTAAGALIGLLLGAFVDGAIVGAIAGAVAGLAIRALRRSSAVRWRRARTTCSSTSIWRTMQRASSSTPDHGTRN